MNLEGVTLKLLLEESNKEKALQLYSELRPDYFSKAFASILSHIRNYYDVHGSIPSLQELKLYRNRDLNIQSMLSTIELLDTSNIDILVAVEELANQFAQNRALDLLDGILDNISIQDRHELLDSVSNLPIKLEEALKKSNKVYSARDVSFFKRKEDTDLTQIITGISDEWDHEMGGYYKQDLVLIGGKRGSGKSIVCANLVANQHKQNKPSMYFTIEMTADETFQRIISILAQVDFKSLKHNTLTLDEKQKVGKIVASLFEGGDAVYEAYFEGKTDPDVYKFQDEVQRLEEKDEGRIIIVDDRDLSVGTIDTQIATYKSRYGQDLGLAVVDYINQVVLEGSKDRYDWKDQIAVATKLKNLARKHDVCMVTPYQIDDSGKARFSKGILDAPDIAQLLIKHEDDPEHIIFQTDKMRSGDDTGKHKVKVHWKTLTIDPRAVPLEEIVHKKEESEEDNGLDLL